MRTRWLLLVCALAMAAVTFAAAPPAKKPLVGDNVKDADGLDEALRNLRAKMVDTPALSPADAKGRLKTRPGLAVDLVAHEPDVRQPLYLNFDERGRMWVVQYRQYPFPAGLKVVSYDRYIRAKFDKVPPPPPNHFPGVDRVSVLEDVEGDGSYSKATTFVDGLNIATAALPGRGGVWVLNPPYLLFYPDPKRSDEPGVPVVHLSGFGLEDTHAVASSLCWGPDGWIYGAQGSTCTAKVCVETQKGDKLRTTDFMGQAIWRYHPEAHVFEVFAEGGGNTFGVAFDDVGRVYSGTNWGKYRGLHYVQGGYYIKGWGKHGPLTNPYALGFFDHMPHVGNADRLVHQFLVYDDGLLPGLRGKIVGVNSLQNRLHVTKLEEMGSTFRTVEEEPFLVTSDDKRFRPVDVKAGPDGALYVADLYEPRINHVDPRDNWDKATGRIYRVRPEKYAPARVPDLAKKTSHELVALLRQGTRWQRDTALRLLGDRKDRDVVGALERMFHIGKTRSERLYALWAMEQVGGLGLHLHDGAMRHADPHVRRWAVRLMGDRRQVPKELVPGLARLAASEKDAEVRGQIASTAKRLPGKAALPVVAALLRRDEDAKDPFVPLLVWWALESKAESDRDGVLRLFDDKALWDRPLVEGTVVERLMQRWAMAGGREDLLACAALLKLAPQAKHKARLLVGLEKGFAGRSAGELPKELRDAVLASWGEGGSAHLALGLRLGHEPAVARALALVADDKAALPVRLECVRIFGEIDQPRAVPVMLEALAKSSQPAVRAEVLAALPRYADERIPAAVLSLYPARLPEANGVRAAALDLLASRPAWSLALLRAIDEKKADGRQVPTAVVQKMQSHKDEKVVALLAKHYGRVRAGTPAEKGREMLRLGKILQGGKGDAKAGAKVFAETCAKCHKLYGKGGAVGPELTGYERSNALYWMENVTDPNALIREEYQKFVVRTKDGRTLEGVVAGQDKTTVTLRDPEDRVTKVARARIEEMEASPVSLMPEGQMKALGDAQIRDLFAYLTSKAEP